MHLRELESEEEQKTILKSHDYECCSGGKGSHAFFASGLYGSGGFHAPANLPPFQLDSGMLGSRAGMGVMTKENPTYLVGIDLQPF
jgi:hypothetical protein